MTRPFIITLRRDNSGGLPTLEPLGNKAAFSARYRAILLVHGYNNSESEALKAFNRFVSYIEQIEPRLVADMGVVFWPGDWRIPLFRKAAYPWRVITARESAGLLTDYLESLRDDQGRPAELILVAHSLGCRFVLESLRMHLATGVDRRITLILMAAAVPLTWVQQEAHWLSATHHLRTVILFSSADRVLHRAFPVGQSLAEPHFGLSQEAVGRFGRPTEGVWWRRQEMSGYDHGDYWGSKGIARILCILLGRSAPRELHLRELTSAEPYEHDGALSRELSQWGIGGFSAVADS
jgi:hypothetical protein